MISNLVKLGTDLKRLAVTFSALANPSRLRILEILSETTRPLHIKAVSREIGIDYAATYRHVEVLKEQGLLDVYEVGRSRVLTVTKPEELQRIIEATKLLSVRKSARKIQ